MRLLPLTWCPCRLDAVWNRDIPPTVAVEREMLFAIIGCFPEDLLYVCSWICVQNRDITFTFASRKVSLHPGCLS